MRLWAVCGLLLVMGVSAAGEPAAARWWAHVRFLADDKLEGRETGSGGHLAAARYVADRFREAGLRPAGTDGYLQPVRFRSRRIVEARSRLALVRGGNAEPIVLGDEATISMRVDPAPTLDAALVFVGYGLRIPELAYDDLSGLDLEGKIAVYVAGAPSRLSRPLVTHYEAVSERWASLRQAGAIGTIVIQHPRGTDVPWERSKLARLRHAVSLADADLDEHSGHRLSVTFNPDRAEKLFSASGHDWSQVAELAKRDERLPRFPLHTTLTATVAVEAAGLESSNVAGLMPGRELKDEFVVVSAHLDHVGRGEPIDGDPIYNGAMDNASGIATLIETAAALRRSRLRRSVVFLALTAEENGLLGSRYYAARPTVPAGGIVANLNTDMFLPLFPFTSVIALGAGESNLADDLHRVAKSRRVAVIDDPEPERNAFVRSDQYSFVRRGVPALALKVGYARGSLEHEAVRIWRRDRYHSPSDDLAQPFDLQSAEDFTQFSIRLVEAVANRQTRPRWHAGSFFARLASQR